jgi:predicted aspartyl protease
MKRGIRMAPWLAGAMLLAGAAQAQQDDCLSKPVAVVDMQTEVSGLVTIPVSIDGVAGRWMVDTGNAVSMISSTLVTQLGIKREPTLNIGVMMGGVPIYEVATVRSLVVAGVHAGPFTLNIAPEQVLETDAIGMLAPDIMRNYDIDFDFAAGQMHILSPDHCPGHAVYWTKAGYARVPITLDGTGHITVPVVLDGHTLTAIVDTGAQNSAMGMSLVKSLFGIGEHDPALKLLGDSAINGLAKTTVYSYPFKTLTFAGVKITDPDITILKDTGLGDSSPDLLLGIETLRQLHLYIAYKEGALYLTPAEVR